MIKITKSAAVIAMLLMLGCNRPADDAAKGYFNEVTSVDKLVLAQMTISKMATVDDLPLEQAQGARQIVAAIGDAMKLGDRRAAYSYDTYLRAYMDMSSLSPEDVQVDELTKTITLNLPAISTEYAGRDMEVREDHYRVTGLRSAIDAKERAAIKERMNTTLKNEVRQKPVFREKLVHQARVKAEAYFRSLLGRDGYTVIVNFK